MFLLSEKLELFINMLSCPLTCAMVFLGTIAFYFCLLGISCNVFSNVGAFCITLLTKDLLMEQF